MVEKEENFINLSDDENDVEVDVELLKKTKSTNVANEIKQKEPEETEDEEDDEEDEAKQDEGETEEDENVGDEDEEEEDENEEVIIEEEEEEDEDQDEDEAGDIENEMNEDENGDEKNKNKKIKYKKEKKGSTLSSTNYAYNIDDELFVENQNFEKIDESLKYDYIKSFHPECIHKNFDEMLKLTFIKRDQSGVINDKLHRTLPFLTKYEKTKVIGLRVKQLNHGSKPFINLKETFGSNIILDNNLIAEKELMFKKIPFIICRPITNKFNEYWNIKDLEII